MWINWWNEIELTSNSKIKSILDICLKKKKVNLIFSLIKHEQAWNFIFQLQYNHSFSFASCFASMYRSSLLQQVYCFEYNAIYQFNIEWKSLSFSIPIEKKNTHKSNFVIYLSIKVYHEIIFKIIKKKNIFNPTKTLHNNTNQ